MWAYDASLRTWHLYNTEGNTVAAVTVDEVKELMKLTNGRGDGLSNHDLDRLADLLLKKGVKVEQHYHYHTYPAAPAPYPSWTPSPTIWRNGGTTVDLAPYTVQYDSK